MSTWRERFLIRCGPGVLAGITLGDWLALLRENRFSVDPAYLPRAVSISFAAVMNSVFRWYEECRYRREVEGRAGSASAVCAGALAQRHDPPALPAGSRRPLRLPAPLSGPLPAHVPEHRATFLRLDGFSLAESTAPTTTCGSILTVPDEDEFAMCVSGFMTPYLAGVFPRRAEHYDQFLTFRNAPAAGCRAMEVVTADVPQEAHAQGTASRSS